MAIRSLLTSASRVASRRVPSTVTVGRRGYAEAADKIKLSLVLPHQVSLTQLQRMQTNVALQSYAVQSITLVAVRISRCRAGEHPGVDW